MMLLNKLDRLLEIHEQGQPFTNVHDFIGQIKSKLRQQFNPYFIKIVFDRTEKGCGIVFIKFSKHPWKDARNEDLANSELNFIISIDGFDGEGSARPDSIFNVDMYKYHDLKNNRRLKPKKFYNFDDTKSYVSKYFESIYEEGGAVASGTASGATSSGVGGVERTEGDIAVKPAHMGLYKRGLGKLNQKQKKTKK